MNYDFKLKVLKTIAIENNIQFDFSHYPKYLSILPNLSTDDYQKKTL